MLTGVTFLPPNFVTRLTHQGKKDKLKQIVFYAPHNANTVT